MSAQEFLGHDLKNVFMLITDIHMEGIDGFGVLKHERSNQDHIEVESEVWKGTTFLIYLPIDKINT